MKNFYRKVAFGLGPDEKVPSDPLEWAKNQLNDIPEFSWKGKILPEKELYIPRGKKNLYVKSLKNLI